MFGIENIEGIKEIGGFLAFLALSIFVIKFLINFISEQRIALNNSAEDFKLLSKENHQQAMEFAKVISKFERVIQESVISSRNLEKVVAEHTMIVNDIRKSLSNNR
jgi:hypothetical protein